MSVSRAISLLGFMAVAISSRDSSKPVVTVDPSGQIYEGDTVILTCKAEGQRSKDSAIRWFRNRVLADSTLQTETIPASGVSLTLRPAVPSDTEIYWCSIMGWDSWPIRFKVHELFSPPMLSVEPSGMVTEGEDVTFRCEVWYPPRKAGESLQATIFFTDDSGRPKAVSAGDQHTFVAERANAGSYYCTAQAVKNDVRKISPLLWLAVREVFISVTLTASPGVRVKAGQPLSLKCSAVIKNQSSGHQDTDRAETSFTFLRDGQPVVTRSHSDLYDIISVNRSHAGKYRCVVNAGRAQKHSQEILIYLQNGPVVFGLGALGFLAATIVLCVKWFSSSL
ncbi:Fc receptor-like protein 2 [Paramormyrops kingsleyae]|uniref:Fc receptor-like protein 2 n=1 Tax=Paramormyrops kingsleyae TaxID=1676925 RepID=UPI003B979EB4